MAIHDPERGPIRALAGRCGECTPRCCGTLSRYHLIVGLYDNMYAVDCCGTGFR